MKSTTETQLDRAIQQQLELQSLVFAQTLRAQKRVLIDPQEILALEHSMPFLEVSRLVWGRGDAAARSVAMSPDRLPAELKEILSKISVAHWKDGTAAKYIAHYVDEIIFCRKVEEYKLEGESTPVGVKVFLDEIYDSHFGRKGRIVLLSAERPRSTAYSPRSLVELAADLIYGTALRELVEAVHEKKAPTQSLKRPFCNLYAQARQAEALRQYQQCALDGNEESAVLDAQEMLEKLGKTPILPGLDQIFKAA